MREHLTIPASATPTLPPRGQPPAAQATPTFWRFDWAAVCLVLAVFIVPLLRTTEEDTRQAQRKAGEPTGYLQQEKWLGFAVFAAYAALRVRLRVRIPTLVSIALGLFVLAATVSSLSAPTDIPQSVARVGSFWLLYAIACVWCIPDPALQRIDLWTRALFFLSCTVVLAIVLLIFLPNSFADGRFRGITLNANTLGTLSALALTAAAVRLMLPGRRTPLCFGVAGVAALSLCLTQSRASIIAAAASIVLAALLIRNVLIICACAAAAGLFLLSPFLAHLWAPPETSLVGREYSLDTRSSIFEHQIESWMESPLLGHGLEVTDDERGRVYAEASYTGLLTAVGLLGFTPFALALAVGYRRLLNRVRQLRSAPSAAPDLLVPLTALAMTTVVLINSIAEGYMAAVGASPAIFTWVILASSGELGPQAPMASNPRKPGHLTPAVTGPGGPAHA